MLVSQKGSWETTQEQDHRAQILGGTTVLYYIIVILGYCITYCTHARSRIQLIFFCRQFIPRASPLKPYVVKLFRSSKHVSFEV